MKIFAPFHVDDVGGTSIFAKKFHEGMQARGHEVVFKKPKDYDVLFVIVHCAPQYLLHAKLHRKKIVHRLDGTYYWSVASWKYPLFNAPPALVHRYFADVTIYQSQYSKYCVEKFLGKARNSREVIIYNGVNTTLFTPKGEKIDSLCDNPSQEIFLSVSKFRRTDQVLPLIEAMKVYIEKYNANAKLVLAGTFSREVTNIPKKFSSLPYLSFIGKVPNQKLPAYERGADIFLFTHLNPPCPNNVLEAMACGLPVCGVADGAMPEITIPRKTSLLIPAKGDAFGTRRQYDIEQFAENMHHIMQNRQQYAKESRRLAENRYTLEQMIGRYIDVCEEVLNS